MVVIETGPTRCANVFLCYLFENVIRDSQSLKLPRDFKNENQVHQFVRDNQNSEKMYLLGLNHMDKSLESRLAEKYNLFMVFLFRNPLESILSSIRLLTFRGIVKNNRQRLKYVLFNIITYNLTFFALIRFKILKKDHLCLTFPQLIKTPKEVILNISSMLDRPASYDSQIVREYLKGSNQKKASDRKTEYPGLKWYEKFFIYTLCYPFYKSLGLFLKLPT